MKRLFESSQRVGNLKKAMKPEHPTIEILTHFEPLKALSAEQLQLLSSILEVQKAKSGARLIAQGSNDDYSYFLIKGRLKLTASDGKVRIIDEKDQSAKTPLAQLRPRMYNVDALTKVEYLKVDAHLLTDIHKSTQVGEDRAHGYTVNESSIENSGQSFADELANHLMSDLDKDELKLPSLPDVAVRIGRALRDEISDADTIAEMIQVDPVITAKLIKAANSAIYGRRVPVDTCSGAVVRLGADVTHKLVLSYAMKELFQTRSPQLKQRMQELWTHSTRVAALCYVLAKIDKRFQAEHALLIGLLHDIGTVPIITYASSYGEKANDLEAIDQIIGQLRGQIGAMILTKWGFSHDFVTAAAEGEDWMRDPDGPPRLLRSAGHLPTACHDRYTCGHELASIRCSPSAPPTRAWGTYAKNEPQYSGTGKRSNCPCRIASCYLRKTNEPN